MSPSRSNSEPSKSMSEFIPGQITERNFDDKNNEDQSGSDFKAYLQDEITDNKNSRASMYYSPRKNKALLQSKVN